LPAWVSTGARNNSPPYTLQLLANADSPGVKVDVIPGQFEHFAAPQAVKHEQKKRHVKRIVLGSH
jgi:hypothetical protein